MTDVLDGQGPAAPAASSHVFERFDTTRRSILHRLFLRRNSPGVFTTRVPKSIIFASCVLVTYVPLLLLASVELQTLTRANPPLRLPFLLDWNLLVTFVLTFPLLILYSVTDQSTLTSALGQIAREGILELPPQQATTLCHVWEQRFAVVNVSGQAVGVVMAILIAWFDYLPYRDPTVGYWIVENSRLTMTGLLFLCDLGMYVGFLSVYAMRSIATGLFLRAIVNESRIKMVPFHPDRCGGLRPVGAIGLRNQYLTSVIGLNILSFIIGKTWLIVPDALLFLMIGLTVTYVVIGPILFVVPLLPFHDGMVRSKSEWMTEVAQRLRVELARVRENLANGDVSKNDEELIQRLQKFGDLIEGFPVWPFDARTVRKFLTAYVVPIVGSIGSVAYPILKSTLLSLLRRP